MAMTKHGKRLEASSTKLQEPPATKARRGEAARQWRPLEEAARGFLARRPAEPTEQTEPVRRQQDSSSGNA